MRICSTFAYSSLVFTIIYENALSGMLATLSNLNDWRFGNNVIHFFRISEVKVSAGLVAIYIRWVEFRSLIFIDAVVPVEILGAFFNFICFPVESRPKSSSFRQYFGFVQIV